MKVQHKNKVLELVIFKGLKYRVKIAHLLILSELCWLIFMSNIR